MGFGFDVRDDKYTHKTYPAPTANTCKGYAKCSIKVDDVLVGP